MRDGTAPGSRGSGTAREAGPLFHLAMPRTKLQQ
jgi:hypothetical protein